MIRPLAVFVIANAVTAQLPATEYHISKIADTSGPFVNFGEPSINALGHVVFTATLNNGTTGLYLATGNGLATLVDSTGALNHIDIRPDINNDDTVAFAATLDGGGDGIFTIAPGGPLLTIASEFNQFSPLTQLTIPAINNAGTVVFTAHFDSDNQGVFIGGNVPITPVYDRSGPFSDFGGETQINDVGQVVFNAQLDGGATGIFLGVGGPTATIVDDQGNFRFFDSAAMDNLGNVAFRGVTRTDVQSGIFSGDGAALTTLVNPAGPFDGVNPAYLNDHGTYAFLGVVGPSEFGIFTGPNPVADAVLLTGTPFDGATLNSIAFGFSRRALNDAGQIVFKGILSDGRVGIYVATPIAVPEPSSLVVLAIGGVLIGSWKRLTQFPT